MGARLLVVGVFVLAAAAAGDALRGEGVEERRDAERERTATAQRPSPLAEFVVPRQGRFEGDGRFVRKRVLRAGREYLSAEQVAAAFPGERRGPIDISEVALAPDGSLVLAVYRFPIGEPAVGALLLFRERDLVSAFRVPPGHFGGGMAFDRTGRLIALFSHDGALRGVYTRGGRRLERFPARFLDG